MTSMANELIEVCEYCLTHTQWERISAARDRLAAGKFITFNELKKRLDIKDR